MDLEELKVILSASTEGFEQSILKAKEQLTGLNKEVDKVNDNLSMKLNNNKINPKIDIDPLKKQIDDLANKISSKTNGLVDKIQSQTKGVFDSLLSGADEAVSKVIDRVKNIKMPSINFPRVDSIKANTSDATSKTAIRGPPKGINAEALKAEIENTAQALDIVNSKIEQQQAKLAQLKETYANTFNETGRNALEEKILKTESAINGLISKSDKLGFKLSDLDAKLASVGRGSGETTSKVNSLSKVTGAFDSIAKSAANTSKKLSEALKGLGSSSSNTNKHMNNMHYGLSNIMRQFFTWMVVLPLVMKALGDMASFLGNAFMTNQQFATSLNQIKSNLYTAFMPIYNAILPALNSLMSSLATATAYIASFINQLFGSTYEAGFKSAQNLQASIGAYEQQEKAAKKAATALGGAGSAAKKAGKDAKSGLMGFDEINKLSEKTPTPAGNGVTDPITPMANMAPIEAKTAEWVKKFKDIMSKIFDPMKQAWDQEGKATMDALKYALGSIWDLAKDIGKTFLDVWDNGTGVRVCTDILKLLQVIFNIIGDIAKAFKTAWDKGDLGKQVVQALFNAFDAILKLLIDIGNTFRDVWNSGLGVEICTNILEILKNIFTIIGQIATSFKTAWDSGLGKQLITDILTLLNGCLRVIKDITASFSKAWETNGNTIAAGILLILDDIVGTISDIANKWANAWENNGAGDTLMNSLLSTLGKILTTIGDIGQGIRESIGKAADTIFPAMIQFATDVSTGLGNVADGFKSIWDNGGQHLFDGIVNLIAKVAELIFKITGGAFKDASGIFKDILAPAIGEVFDVVGTLIDKLAEFTDWINNNKPLIDILSAALVGIGTALAGAKIASLLAGAIEAIKLFGLAIRVTFCDGLVAGVVEILGGIVAAIGGWPILIAAAIVGIGVVIYNHWDEIKAKTADIWNGIKDFFSKWGTDLLEFFTTGQIANIGITIYKHWDEIKTKTSEIWEGIKIFFSQWGTDILAFFVGGPIGLVVNEVAKHWDEISAKTSEIWNGISTWLGTKWGEISQSASTKFNDIKTYVGQKWEDVKTDAATKWENIKTTLSQKWDTITTASSNTWNNIKDYLSKKWDEANTDASSKWETIKTTLGNKWSGITTNSSITWDNIKKYISDKWTEVNNDAPGLWDKINTTLTGKWNEISTSSQGVWNGIVTWISSTFSTDWSTAWSDLVKDFGRIWDGLKTLAKGPINAVIGWINSLISSVNTAIKALNKIHVDIPDWVPGEMGGKSFGIHLDTIDSIPALATGGIINSPTLAMVGEAGKEAVMPLENNTGWITELATKIAGIIGVNSNSVSASSGDSGDVIFMLDGEILGRVAIKQLLKMKKQGVKLDLT